jgi:exopolysaccharide biosynthesis polyprenyl glycosylphosphotransferase
MAAFHRSARQAETLAHDVPAATPATAVEGVVSPHRQTFALREKASRRELAGQLLVVWCAAYLAVGPSSSTVEAVWRAALVSGIWVVLFQRTAQAFRAMTFAAGAYVVAGIAAVLGMTTLSAIGYWVHGLELGRGPLAVVGLATFVALGTWDVFVRRAASAPRRVLVVGGGQATAQLLDHIDAERHLNLEVVGVVDDSIDPLVAKRVGVTAGLDHLSATVRRLSPDLVVIAVQRGRPEVFGQLLLVAETGFRISGLPEMYESTFGRLPIEELTPAWFMSVLHAYNRPTSRLGKRAFDIVVALLGMLVSLPLVPAIVFVVKRTKGPLLYRQQRLGEHGRVFTMLKFRSMRPDAEADGGARWASQDDNRIIPGGRLLRRLRLDELPQLWNVLRGEMSIVGPRPERPEFFDYLGEEVPFWGQRNLLKPGITGWAQIRSDYAADAMATTEKLSYDLWYLRHRSVLLDTMICLRTLPRMATFRGAR